MLGLVISHLDYCNSILAGLPDVSINQMQRVQNLAAKGVLGKSKRDSATECLSALFTGCQSRAGSTTRYSLSSTNPSWGRLQSTFRICKLPINLVDQASDLHQIQTYWLFLSQEIQLLLNVLSAYMGPSCETVCQMTLEVKGTLTYSREN